MLVLDEPTSGLDSEMSLAVMATCSSLTLLGHTVVCTIHQPRADIYRLFNEVMYIAKGTVVWRGPPMESVSVFEKVRTRHTAAARTRLYALDREGGASQPRTPHVGCRQGTVKAAPLSHLPMCVQLEPEESWSTKNKKWKRLKEQEEQENIAMLYDNPSDFILDCLVALELDEIMAMKVRLLPSHSVQGRAERCRHCCALSSGRKLHS